MSEYSTLQFEQRTLIIKHPETGAAFVVASVYLSEMAQTICDLLTQNEIEKEQKQNEN